MVKISAELRKGKEPVLWMRIKDIGRELDVNNICDSVDKEIKSKFETNYPTKLQIRKCKRHGSEFIERIKFMYAHECIVVPVIMHCRISTQNQNQLNLDLNLDLINMTTMTKEQSLLKSVMDAFEGENMQTQCSVLGYRIELYFHDYKLVIEVREKGHKDRNIDHEIKRQKTLEKELGCEFIRIDPDEESVNIFKAINEIHRHITKSTKKLTEESTKKSLIKKLLNKLLRLEFKSNNSIKTKCLTCC